MKIKKILLYNFKNFKEKTVIDFNEDVTFLVGPNGFGKTTIFDAIEIGLTGVLSRVKSKENITPENTIYNKPFFQNDINQPVIIKIWLEKSKDNNFIIVRKFDGLISKGKRVFAPKQSLRQFVLFQQEDFLQFDNINAPLLHIQQDIINDFFDLGSDFGIENIYDLFNYIQQEETTYFLKQSEQQRSDSLSFLLKTEKLEDKVKKIASTCRSLNLSQKKLIEQRDALITQQLSAVDYQKLFLHKEFSFDKKIPFKHVDINQFDSFKKIVQQIIEFKQYFSVTEYQKKLQKDTNIHQIKANNSFFYYIILPILERNNFQWEKYTLNNMWLFEYILLENHIINYDVISYNFNRKNKFEEYLKNLSVNLDMIDAQYFSTIDRTILSEENLSFIQNLTYSYQELKKNTNDAEKNLNNLVQLRNKLEKEFENLSYHGNIERDHCPFCDTHFTSYENLFRAYKKYGDYLTEISSESNQRLQEVTRLLENKITELKQTIETEINKIPLIDEQIKDKIEYYSNMRKLNTWNEQNIHNFKAFIQQYSQIPFYNYIEFLPITKFEHQLNVNKNDFLNKLPFDNIIYQKINNINFENKNEEFSQLKEKYPNFNFDNYKIDFSRKVTQNDIEKIAKELKEDIIKHINSNYHINESLLYDPNHIFSTYFNQDTEILEACQKSALENKISYLDFQSSLVKDKYFNLISEKITTLNSALNHLNKVNDFYKEEITQYKINMIKQLRIPFFVYSAKILQNYQQGLGVFLTYKTPSETQDDKAVIKFRTDPLNDHDAMHQLSTGQLAVVSLSFTLSLNTMFKLSDHLQFLLIDDPIQDMDSMNVLSFIEILRHSILGEYQVILSTYSDSSALFMGYKFANSSNQTNIEYKNVRELQEI